MEIMYKKLTKKSLHLEQEVAVYKQKPNKLVSKFTIEHTVVLLLQCY